MCVCVCARVHMYVCVCTFVCVLCHICIHLHLSICISIYMYTSKRTHLIQFAFISGNSSLEPLFEGLFAQINVILCMHSNAHTSQMCMCGIWMCKYEIEKYSWINKHLYTHLICVFIQMHTQYYMCVLIYTGISIDIDRCRYMDLNIFWGSL